MSENDQTRHHAGDTAFIQALAELLNRNELTEISVKREYGENDRLTVSLSKHGKQVLVQAAAAPMQALPAPVAPPAQPAAAAPAGAGDPASHPGAVTSPMVGTAYLSAEPDAAPFVSIGQTVAEGDTLMIVEAMKTMNHIPAPRAGTVRRVLVEDGTPVEFGTPLMIVE
ncbi:MULTISPECIES: acetyl-CoA carboxylase biotin carboxyl carrier protein [unclassified Paracoccus (in: a-proteobacteria)]|uniref:acetyl-CoA carboxylase biotin carboxyl carrier protein n=1 Tax=unclassified Paracoccus (in: a-proteobacteria) TaxID=2688777 RepID=UPI00160277FF|nr:MULTISPECIES: acetyl-CoA carboxylase biotin carboxyl carrier protein [unclassified Paracoccus (in: a-proteobacteria)]MBB1490887.1 acetyl-CoA carboxylase biotin carboxyl carrier protein [Paracoccus sp. MC1854]MBB1497769.1 acetyl-CoA carboxylase biotin carboxyl carrier protein [Paracoccus sp. MC1862]QQO45250.1 acetyl-CoA carboxylase biotin carboxyl carrier protein [Paracoccus sp. MC1862]